MRTKKPATHTGIVTKYRPGKDGKFVSEEVQLVEHKLTWEDKGTGQKYSKRNGCVRPCNTWDTRMLQLDTIKHMEPQA